MVVHNNCTSLDLQVGMPTSYSPYLEWLIRTLSELLGLDRATAEAWVAVAALLAIILIVFGGGWLVSVIAGVGLSAWRALGHRIHGWILGPTDHAFRYVSSGDLRSASQNRADFVDMQLREDRDTPPPISSLLEILETPPGFETSDEARRSIEHLDAIGQQVRLVEEKSSGGPYRRVLERVVDAAIVVDRDLIRSTVQSRAAMLAFDRIYLEWRQPRPFWQRAVELLFRTNLEPICVVIETGSPDFVSHFRKKLSGHSSWLGSAVEFRKPSAGPRLQELRGGLRSGQQSCLRIDRYRGLRGGTAGGVVTFGGGGSTAQYLVTCDHMLIPGCACVAWRSGIFDAPARAQRQLAPGLSGSTAREFTIYQRPDIALLSYADAAETFRCANLSGKHAAPCEPAAEEVQLDRVVLAHAPRRASGIVSRSELPSLPVWRRSAKSWRVFRLGSVQTYDDLVLIRFPTLDVWPESAATFSRPGDSGGWLIGAGRDGEAVITINGRIAWYGILVAGPRVADSPDYVSHAQVARHVRNFLTLLVSHGIFAPKTGGQLGALPSIDFHVLR